MARRLVMDGESYVWVDDAPGDLTTGIVFADPTAQARFVGYLASNPTGPLSWANLVASLIYTYSTAADASGPFPRFTNPAVQTLEQALQQYNQSNFDWQSAATLARSLAAPFGFSEAELIDAAKVFAAQHYVRFASGYTEASNYATIAVNIIRDALNARGEDGERYVTQNAQLINDGARAAVQRWQATQKPDSNMFGGLLALAAIAAAVYTGGASLGWFSASEAGLAAATNIKLANAAIGVANGNPLSAITLVTGVVDFGPTAEAAQAAWGADLLQVSESAADAAAQAAWGADLLSVAQTTADTVSSVAPSVADLLTFDTPALSRDLIGIDAVRAVATQYGATVTDAQALQMYNEMQWDDIYKTFQPPTGAQMDYLDYDGYEYVPDVQDYTQADFDLLDTPAYDYGTPGPSAEDLAVLDAPMPPTITEAAKPGILDKLAKAAGNISPAAAVSLFTKLYSAVNTPQGPQYVRTVPPQSFRAAGVQYGAYPTTFPNQDTGGIAPNFGPIVQQLALPAVALAIAFALSRR